MLLFSFVFQIMFITNNNIVSSKGGYETHTYFCNGNNATAIEGGDLDGSFILDNEVFDSYDDIVNNDDNYVYDTAETGYQYHKFNFTIDENVEDIIRIDIMWVGYGSKLEANTDEYLQTLWIKESGSYVKRKESSSDSKDILSTYYDVRTHSPYVIENIIEEGHLFFAARSEYLGIPDNPPLGGGPESVLKSYYIEVIVTYSSQSSEDPEVLSVSNPGSVVEFESFDVAVTNSSGIAVSGASVDFDGSNITTDDFGVASFSAPEFVSSSPYVIVVSKPGFVGTSSSIVVLDNDSSSHELDVSVPVSVVEGESFDVTVTSDDEPVSGVSVVCGGSSGVSDGSGGVSLTAPLVVSNSYVDVAASLDGYVDGSAQILVVNNDSSVPDPELSIVCPVSVYESESFDVTVTSDDEPVSGVSVSFAGAILETDSSGLVSFVSPSVGTKTDYSVVASKQGYVSDSTIVSVFDSSSTDVVLSYPIGDETLSGVVEVLWSVVNPPAVNIADPDSYASIGLWYKPSDGSWTSIVSDLVLSSASYTWDTKSVDDGNYFLKVVLEADGIFYEDVSGSFIIDNNGSSDGGDSAFGWVYGKIKDSDTYDSIKNAEICLRLSEDSSVYRCVYSDEDGNYNLSVSPGEYLIKINKKGYGFKTKDVEINENSGTNTDFVLEKTSLEEANSYTTYSINQEILKGSIFGKVDVSASKGEIFVYDDVNVNILSNDISSEEGINIQVSGNGTPGTKLVIYIGIIDEPNNLVIKYDGQVIGHSNDVESFFEVGYNASEYVLSTILVNENVETILIVNVPSYSEHIISISSISEAVGIFVSVLLYIIIFAVLGIFYISPFFLVRKSK